MKHAKLSPSSSHRWIACPGSIMAEIDLPGFSTIAGREGTLVHSIANEYIKNIKNTSYTTDITELVYSLEELRICEKLNFDERMQYAFKIHEDLTKCANYIRANIIQDKKGKMWLDQSVTYNHITPDGFGRLDFMFYTEDKRLHIVDLKYGKTYVEVKDNSQLLLYASGALVNVKKLDIEEISLHILQPRYLPEGAPKDAPLLENFQSWTITLEEFRRIELWLKEKAEAALRQDAPRIPSAKACEWCKASKLRKDHPRRCQAQLQFKYGEV